MANSTEFYADLVRTHDEAKPNWRLCWKGKRGETIASKPEFPSRLAVAMFINELKRMGITESEELRQAVQAQPTLLRKILKEVFRCYRRPSCS